MNLDEIDSDIRSSSHSDSHSQDLINTQHPSSERERERECEGTRSQTSHRSLNLNTFGSGEEVNNNNTAVLMQSKSRSDADVGDGRDRLVHDNEEEEEEEDVVVGVYSGGDSDGDGDDGGDGDGDGDHANEMNDDDVDEDIHMHIHDPSQAHELSHELEVPTAVAAASAETLVALPEPATETKMDPDPGHDPDPEPELDSHSDHHHQRIVPIPPPRQSEQTAREQLIERERQARLERERARLKRQLARLRARDEEDEAFADADIARVNSDDSIANTHDHSDRSVSASGIGLGIGIGERYDSLHVHDLTTDVDVNVAGGIDGGDGAEGNEDVSNLRIVPSDEEDDKSLACTVGRGDDDGSTGGNIDVEGHGYAHGNGHIENCPNEGNGNIIGTDGHGHGADRQQPSPSPLGFTMERFLQDGVVVRHTQINRNGRGMEEGEILEGEVAAATMEMDIDVNMTTLEDGEPHLHALPSPPLMDLRPGSLPLIVPPAAQSALSIEPAASSIIVDQLSSPYPTSSHDEHEHGDGEPPLTPNQADENRSNEALHMNLRVPSPITVLNASSLEPREEPHDDMARIGIMENSDDDSSRRGSDMDIVISREQPRLAQLSEAGILEIADIDYASVGNMPPRSVRDERHLPDVSGSAFSEQTRTTILESVSATTIDTRTSSAEFDEGCSDTRISSIDMDLNMNMHPNSREPIGDDGDDGPTPNVSPIHHRHPPHNVAVGVASIPPSLEALISPVSQSSLDVQGSEAERSVISDSDRKPAAIPMIPAPKPNLHELKLEIDTEDEGEDSKWPESDGHDAIEETVVVIKESTGSVGSYALPNRTIRPGMNKGPPPPIPGIQKNRSKIDSSNVLHRRAQTTPNFTSFVDDFDYCKYNDGAINGGHSSTRPPTMFSPLYDENELGDAATGRFVDNRTREVEDPANYHHLNHNGGTRSSFGHRDYGATNGQGRSPLDRVERGESQSQPLLVKAGINNEVIFLKNRDDMVDSIFSSVRSLSTADLEAEINDCDEYLASSIFARAFPERFFTLTVTLIIEIPVLYMIAGGSDRLISLIGHDRYRLLIAFLPLSSALSGNCGLQASTLAIRAISHLHVTRANYLSWLLSEVGVASVLGLGIGLVVGILAYLTSNSDLPFSCTIAIANFFGILSAGLTGTLAPLICTFIFHRDASKWSGPLETAIQDNIATLVMVILSYNILLWLGPDAGENVHQQLENTM